MSTALFTSLTTRSLHRASVRAVLAALLMTIGLLASAAFAQGDAARSEATFPNGIKGDVELTPSHGTVGSRATIRGTGFVAGSDIQIAWGAFEGSWRLESKDGEYTGNFLGRQFQESDVALSTVRVGSDGTFSADFEVPEGFGGTHDVYVREDGVNVNKSGFAVDMSATMSPESGPVGSDITLTVTGIDILNNVAGWYAVMYDNAITGFVTAVETQGTAKVVIPAAGRAGKHLVQLRNAPFNAPYLALASSPYGYLPEPKFTFTVTDGDPIMPPDASTQGPATVAGSEPTGDGPKLWTDPVSSGVFTEGHIHGKGFAANTDLDLAFTNMAGSRVTLAGYGAGMVEVGKVTTDADGAFTLPFETPDVLGGEHRLEARTGDVVVATTHFNITPVFVSLDPSEGPFGTDIMLHMKGIGWTQTDNIFAVVIDNVFFGYACGFSTNGDVKVPFTASWAPGWHTIDLYPSLYRNKDYSAVDEQPFLYRQAILTWQDHPNKIHFRFMFYVTE